jgi:branched-subunit amino acid permease
MRTVSNNIESSFCIGLTDISWRKRDWRRRVRICKFRSIITIGLVLLSAQLDEKRACDHIPTTVKSHAILAVLLAIIATSFVIVPPNVDATIDNAVERTKAILNYMKKGCGRYASFCIADRDG